MFKPFCLAFAIATTVLPAQAQELTPQQRDVLHQTVDACNQAARFAMLDAHQAMMCSLSYRLLSDQFDSFADYADIRAMRREGGEQVTSLF